jgi:hypothetical protein
MNVMKAIEQITALLKERATHDEPLSKDDLMLLRPALANSISGTLSRIMLNEKHIHRRWRDSGRTNARGRKVPEYVYWFDKDYVNPLHGQERISTAGGKGKKNNESPNMKRVRSFLSQHQPQPLQITVGGHAYTVSEARFLYRELKELFG